MSQKTKSNNTSNTNTFAEAKNIVKKNGIKSLFVGDTDNTLIQFFRYVFVGGLATVVDWGVSYLLFRIFRAAFGHDYAVLANSISFVCGLIVNYVISTYWIFKNSKVKNKFIEFLGFAGIGVVGLLITMGITKLFEIWLAVRLPGSYQILAKIVSTAVSFLWNFFARKFLLFDKKGEEEMN